MYATRGEHLCAPHMEIFGTSLDVHLSFLLTEKSKHEIVCVYVCVHVGTCVCKVHLHMCAWTSMWRPEVNLGLLLGSHIIGVLRQSLSLSISLNELASEAEELLFSTS